MQDHNERAHSKYSASGAERYFNCPGSVALSEGLPDKTNVWAEEGTRAHELVEGMLVCLSRGVTKFSAVIERSHSEEMIRHAKNTANFIWNIYEKYEDAELLVEQKVYLDFIHPEMFGTFDGAVVDLFGTLHVFDFKYGAGHAVSANDNLQMAFYGIGLAHKYNWNFKKVKLWIIQPRIKGFDGPTYWELPILSMKDYVKFFKDAVERVLEHPEILKEGPHCYYCKAKGICPLKVEKRHDEAVKIFSIAKT